MRRRLFKQLGLEFAENYYLNSPVGLPENVSRVGVHSPAMSYEAPVRTQENTSCYYSFPTRYIYSLDECIVDVADNLIYRSDGRLIAESSAWPINRLLWEVPVPMRTTADRYLSGEYIYYAVTKNYYHWLIEDLPVFLSARNTVPNAKILVPKTVFPPAAEFLRYLINDGETVIIDDTVRAERLVIAAKVAGIGSPHGHNVAHPADIERLREWMILYGPKTTNRLEVRDRVYVSRLGYRRSIQNEDILVQYLRNAGYFIFDGVLPFFDQVALFSAAKVVIGASGAGLTNVVWMAPQTHLIEINESLDRFHFFSDLSKFSQVVHHSFELRTAEWTEADIQRLIQYTSNLN